MGGHVVLAVCCPGIPSIHPSLLSCITYSCVFISSALILVYAKRKVKKRRRLLAFVSLNLAGFDAYLI